jgi:multisubunit Na+/H+ antiporter MnhE subunit
MMPAVLVLGLATQAQARVTQLVLDPPTFPYGTTSFGTTGPYEQVDGTAYGEVDPLNPLNALIQDIELAPRNARGMVEYTTKVSILKPIGAGNSTMLLEIVNRGNKINPGFYNVGATAANPQGDGFLENQGFTLVWVGWQADLSPLASLITMSAPIAHESGGGTITGPVRSEFILRAPASTQPILANSSSNTPGYATASLDNSRDTLTMRVHQDDARLTVANSDWAYADCTAVPFPGTPDPRKVCLKAGFDTDHIYELTYTAVDPIVMGLGLAALRDVGAFLRYATTDDFGQPNPVAGRIRWSLLNGISQSGRLLRTYLELGFNQDEAQRQVFDGMAPHIGSVRNYINVRFSQPGRLAGTQHTEKQYPGPEGPLTYQRSFDPVSGERAGLLDRCRASRTCPKIVHTMSDTEYWEASGAFDTVDASGARDLALPPDVRIYQFSSTQHGGFSPVAPLPTSTGICEQLPNANSYTYNIRALLVALRQWVAHGVPAPPSSYSTLAAGTLVPAESVAFPAIPGVTGPSGIWNTRVLYDRGADYRGQDVSGIVSLEPPLARDQYPTLLPQVNADGNDLAGLRSVTLMAPLGTYTGWNVRRAGFSQADACDLTGSFIPFAFTRDQREASGDPRASLQERYESLDDYAARARAAARHLVHRRYLLQSDQAAAVHSAVEQARQAGLLGDNVTEDD